MCTRVRVYVCVCVFPGCNEAMELVCMCVRRSACACKSACVCVRVCTAMHVYTYITCVYLCFILNFPLHARYLVTLSLTNVIVLIVVALRATRVRSERFAIRRSASRGDETRRGEERKNEGAF